MEIRKPQGEEVDVLAKLWYDGWQDAHAQILSASGLAIREIAARG